MAELVDVGLAVPGVDKVMADVSFCEVTDGWTDEEDLVKAEVVAVFSLATPGGKDVQSSIPLPSNTLSAPPLETGFIGLNRVKVG